MRSTSSHSSWAIVSFRRIAAVLALACSAGFAARAHALSMTAMATEEIARQASLIAVGACGGVQPAGTRLPALNLAFRPERTVKGPVLDALTVRFPGRLPPCRTGESLLVFLKPGPQGTYLVAGFTQGLFRVRRDLLGVLRLDRTGTLALQDADTGQALAPAPSEPELDDFIFTLRKVPGL